MSIDARVKTVHHNEDGSGWLDLIDRPGGGPAGQSTLRYDSAPHEVTALNGLDIWGGAGQVMLGHKEIAKRDGYTKIEFVDDALFRDAVRAYHAR